MLYCARKQYMGLGMSDKTIQQLNREMGGMRLFSAADYVKTKECDESLMKMIREAKSRGLKLKVITKRPDFVDKYHDYIDTINVSVDSIGSGVPWKEAQRLRKAYPNVYVRAVALNEGELADWGDRDWVDIITPFHMNKAPCLHRLRTGDPDVRKEVEARRRDGEEIKDTVVFQDMNPKKHPRVKQLLEKEFGKSTCCIYGSCGTCRVKCAAGKCKRHVVEAEGHELSDEDLHRNTTAVLKTASHLGHGSNPFSVIAGAKPCLRK